MHEIRIPDRKGLREFGFTIGATIAALFGLLIPWLRDADFPLWPWILFALLAAAGLAVPQALGPVYMLWMRFGAVLSRITSPIVLGIIYFGIVVPMGLIMRLGRRDPMARHFDRAVPSYRVSSEQPSRDNMERPF